MPTAALIGSLEQPDPGQRSVLAALRAALPAWRVEVAAGPGAPLRADAVIAAGVSVEEPARSRRGAATRAWSLLLGRRTALLGISLAPIRGMRRRAVARLIVRRSGLLVLRDVESAQALAANGVAAPFRIGADPAWAHAEPPASPRATVPPTRDRIAAVVCSQVTGREDGLVAALRPLARAGLGLDLIPWTAGDQGLAVRLAHTLDGRARALAAAPDIPALAASLRDARAVLALRHHALVAAAIAGRPFVALAGESGARDLAGSLRQRYVEPGAAAAELTAALGHATGAPGPAPRRVEAQRASSREGLRLLRLFLDGGRSADADRIKGLPLEPAPSR